MSDDHIGRRVLRAVLLVAIAIGSFLVVVALAQVVIDLLSG